MDTARERIEARIEGNARFGATMRLAMAVLFTVITLVFAFAGGARHLRPFALLYVAFTAVAAAVLFAVRRSRWLRLRHFWLLPLLDIPVITAERWMFRPHARMPGGVGLIALCYFLCFVALSLFSLERRVVLATTAAGALGGALLLLGTPTAPVLVPTGLVTLLLSGTATYFALGHMRGLLATEAAQAQALRRLLAGLEAAREDERVRIARDLHDELGAHLSALGYAVALARRRAQADPGGTARNLAEIDDLLSRARAAVRAIVTDLRPPLLEVLGLREALGWLAARAAERTGLPIEMDFSGEERGVDPAGASAAFRVLQEALTNVARHARARRVCVSVRACDGLTMTVEDDGVGLPEEALGRGAGLLGMRERARGLGGDLTASARPGGGTRVELRLPAGAPGPADPGGPADPAGPVDPADPGGPADAADAAGPARSAAP